ncbi:hypothetical protein H0A36_06100 [Endozoicomonas sp. SM1973]|uniref:Response regulatory domain-containing protein n=1 Tax=Spartinivicinus marinus TaxID=2994442 RepID=A0A853I7N6_9GAMM|nr:hypothetical protein [Spartinivicinus marinus]MCX4028242.1 hypothetical protein [Spartinivicinus marinus]NYZ65577.1 hypothetical protein [Spartinivicinus marinus]
MSSQHTIAIYDESFNGPLTQRLTKYFEVIPLKVADDCFTAAENPAVDVIVLRVIGSDEQLLTLCQQLYEFDQGNNISVVLVADCQELDFKVKALEMGCHDLIASTVSDQELSARITKEIFHSIASRQLKKRLQLKIPEFAEDKQKFLLNTVIDFTLEALQTENIDELSQQLFKTMRAFNLECSLQLRCHNSVKNMEAHGMAKALESQLLDQLKGMGKRYQFGKKMVFNYGDVSLLVKFIPEQIEQDKDLVFTLIEKILQVIDRQLSVLEERSLLKEQREIMKMLVLRVHRYVQKTGDSCQEVVQQVATMTEKTTQHLVQAIARLPIDDNDLSYCEGIINHNTHQFNTLLERGSCLDEDFEQMICQMADIVLSNKATDRVRLISELLTRKPV